MLNDQAKAMSTAEIAHDSDVASPQPSHGSVAGVYERNKVSTVLVVDDFEPFRQRACVVLEGRPQLQVVGQAADGLEAVQKAEELQPDLILLDIGMPHLNGIEAADRIRKLAPESKILFLSQESSLDIVEEVLRRGANGYVVKAQVGSELLPAMDAVLQGRSFVSSALRA
jgi:DNA-binding NarL/FixJ family response regulator